MIMLEHSCIVVRYIGTEGGSHYHGVCSNADIACTIEHFQNVSEKMEIGQVSTFYFCCSSCIQVDADVFEVVEGWCCIAAKETNMVLKFIAG